MVVKISRHHVSANIPFRKFFEMSLASIPFIMMLMCIFAVRYAAKTLKESDKNEG